MMEQVETNSAPNSKSLTATLAIAFVALSLVGLLVAGSLELYAYFLAQQQVVSGEQRLIAQQAANEVQSFVQERFGELETAVKISRSGRASAADLEQDLEKLLGLEPAFRDLVWFEAEGQAAAHVSRLAQTVGSEAIKRFNLSITAKYS